MLKVRTGLICLALLAVGVFAVQRMPLPGDGSRAMTRQECVQRRTSNAKMRIRLSGDWGGQDDATITYSVTDQAMVGPFDVPAPHWETFVYVRVCDLILLNVTPTAGKGDTRCAIKRANRNGRGTSSVNHNGGPAQCAYWYDEID